MSSLAALDQNFWYAVALGVNTRFEQAKLSVYAVMNPRYRTERHELYDRKNMMTLLKLFVGDSITQYHQFRDTLYDGMKERRLASHQTHNTYIFRVDNQQYELNNWFCNYSVPRRQNLYVSGKNIAKSPIWNAQKDDDIEVNVARLRGLVTKVVDFFLGSVTCIGCNRLAEDEICFYCKTHFNFTPCTVCGVQFGEIKKGQTMHAHCRRASRKRRRTE